MNINLSKAAGFCSGVKRAIKIALETAEKETNVLMLGDIVHNEDVTAMVNEKGIKKISSLADGRDKTLLIRAHGASQKTIKDAEENGYKVVDATCPMVKEIHDIARKAEGAGRTVIIVGDKNHDEVIGIAGQLSSRHFIISGPLDIPLELLRGIEKATLVVQSTQNIDNVLAILRKLTQIIPDVAFKNTICMPTKIKQEEARTLPLENDVVLVIGSPTSANTKRLYEISKDLNPKTYWIQSADDIKKEWFASCENVGVTAGASTPEGTIEAVVEKLKSY